MPVTIDSPVVVQTGAVLCDRSVREWTYSNGDSQYDWIADSVGGNYRESDMLFDSVDEAMADLGVR